MLARNPDFQNSTFVSGADKVMLPPICKSKSQTSFKP